MIHFYTLYRNELKQRKQNCFICVASVSDRCVIGADRHTKQDEYRFSAGELIVSLRLILPRVSTFALAKACKNNL